MADPWDLDEALDIVQMIARRNPQGSAGRCHYCGAYIEDGPRDAWDEPHTDDCLYMRACAVVKPNREQVIDALRADGVRSDAQMACCEFLFVTKIDDSEPSRVVGGLRMVIPESAWADTITVQTQPEEGVADE